METKKILITEDSPTILAMVKEIMRSEGYSVITAEDGFTALNMARSERPDLIILDLMLPKMDGYKVCRMLKFDANFKEIPILMLTARSSAMDMQMGEAVGADAYMIKPFEIEDLSAKVRELLGN